MTRPCKKLDSKWIELFSIVRRLEQSFRLELSSSMQVHNVFHVSLLTKDPADPLPEQEYLEPVPVETKDEEEGEVKEIVDMKGIDRTLKAYAKWIGGPEDLIYYLIQNFESSKELLKNYFKRHSTKKASDGLFIDGGQSIFRRKG